MARFEPGRQKTGGRKAGTPNKATAVKEIVHRLATEDGEKVYDTILAALAAHGHPISMAAARLCLEYGVGLPNRMQQDRGHTTLTVSTRYPPGTDPFELRAFRELKAEMDQRGITMQSALALITNRVLNAAPARRETNPRPLTDALMKARRTVPKVIQDPAEPDVELEPVTDSDLPDNPNLDVRGR